MKNNIKRKDNIKSVTLVIDAYDDRKLEIPLEVWQVDVICRMLGLSVDTANLDTYSMRSKEQVDEDMKMYYHILRNLHNKEQDNITAGGNIILKIIPQNTENLLWNKLYNEYKFTPKIHGQFEWIKIPIENKTYHKDTPWSDEQEHLINSFLEELVSDKMYAFDWQHDCFTFSPKEYIPCDYEYYDTNRKCTVYFPTYYPNGDYHLFFDSDWKYGIFGNPWKKEIIVMGKNLIKKFESNKTNLNIN